MARATARWRKLALTVGVVAVVGLPGAASAQYTGETPPPQTPPPETEVLGIEVERGTLPVTGADVLQLGALGMWAVAMGGALTRNGKRQRAK